MATSRTAEMERMKKGKGSGWICGVFMFVWCFVCLWAHTTCKTQTVFQHRVMQPGALSRPGTLTLSTCMHVDWILACPWGCSEHQWLWFLACTHGNCNSWHMHKAVPSSINFDSWCVHKQEPWLLACACITALSSSYFDSRHMHIGTLILNAHVQGLWFLMHAWGCTERPWVSFWAKVCRDYDSWHTLLPLTHSSHNVSAWALQWCLGGTTLPTHRFRPLQLSTCNFWCQQEWTYIEIIPKDKKNKNCQLGTKWNGGMQHVRGKLE